MAEPEGTPQDWRQSLPEELRFNDGLSKFKDVGSVAKSYLELEKKLGSAVSIPKDTDKEDEWNNFYGKWGRPGKPEEYEFPKLPEQLKIDDQFGGSVKSLAHKMGLNKRQFQQLVEWGSEQSLAMMNEQNKARETNQGKLKNEWGFTYNDKLEKAHKTLAMLVGFKEDHPFIKYLENSSMGDDPEFLKFLYDVGTRLGEDTFVDSKTKTDVVEKDQAKQKINEIRADQKHPYWNEQDPRHGDAVREMDRLYKQVYGEE